jgi:negative regulator of sigma E activity
MANMTNLTNLDSLPSASADASLLVVEAFIDGEAIDLEALKEALAQPEGREHLAELLALRDAVWTMAPRGYSPIERKRRPVERGIRWFAIAAGVLLSVATGYLAGQGTASRAAESSGVEAIMDLSVAPPPQPTHVSPLRPGVNWTETAGAH